MNKKFLLFVFLIVLLALPVVNAREGRDLTVGLLGDVGATLTEFFEFLTYEVRIPHPADYGYEDERVTIVQFFAVFILLYAAFWAGLSRTKLFSDTKLRGARIGFTIALTLLVIFVSPITEWISQWIGTLTAVGLILAVIVGIFLMVNLTKRGIRGSRVGGEPVDTKDIDRTTNNLEDNAQDSERSDEVLQQHINDNIEGLGGLEQELREVGEIINNLVAEFNSQRNLENLNRMRQILASLKERIRR
jgi:hypothetical protein